ncbi:nucleoside-diphosphate kinase [bacterium]|nr:nucleoside-diphosphate kinase [bacterium]
MLLPEELTVDTERTLLMIKPDGVRRGLIGQIIARIEQKGMMIRNIRMFQMDDAFGRLFYAEHVEREFFPALLAFMTSGPVVALEIESPHAVAFIRTIIGATRPEDRLPGTIRGDYSIQLTENVVHASASFVDAEKELALVFGAPHTLSTTPQQETSANQIRSQGGNRP